MDYGYQVLRHVLQQVFGNIGAAARITLILLAIPAIVLIATNPWLLSGQAMQTAFAPDAVEGPTANAFGLFIGAILGILCWIWAAVAWHRFVLLEEYPNGALPAWRGPNILNYFGNILLIGLVLILASLAFGLVISIVSAAFGNVAILFLLGIGLVFGLTWVSTRIGLILPAAAIGEKLTINESWKATAPVSGQIVLPIFVIALAFGLIGQLIIAAFGSTSPVEFGGQTFEQVTLSTPGLILNIAVSWVQMLVNLALMTTLYGNLIEGRQLN
ncbi:hypothetical protein V8J82_07475 [Gymnodinialimonas sp. 2305UL16-5]|uniref:hypothetical protein n=1 Tax=Gymnodinialimonas mytili TaxID=3126503 RepID=UPI0030AA5AD7